MPTTSQSSLGPLGAGGGWLCCGEPVESIFSQLHIQQLEIGQDRGISTMETGRTFFPWKPSCRTFPSTPLPWPLKLPGQPHRTLLLEPRTQWFSNSDVWNPPKGLARFANTHPPCLSSSSHNWDMVGTQEMLPEWKNEHDFKVVSSIICTLQMRKPRHKIVKKKKKVTQGSIASRYRSQVQVCLAQTNAHSGLKDPGRRPCRVPVPGPT